MYNGTIPFVIVRSILYVFSNLPFFPVEIDELSKIYWCIW